MCFCFKQKTAYEMRISDWSSDVCSSNLTAFPFSTWIGQAPPSHAPDWGRSHRRARKSPLPNEGPPIAAQLRLRQSAHPHRGDLPPAASNKCPAGTRLCGVEPEGPGRPLIRPDRKRLGQGKSVAGQLDNGGPRQL